MPSITEVVITRTASLATTGVATTVLDNFDEFGNWDMTTFPYTATSGATRVSVSLALPTGKPTSVTKPSVTVLTSKIPRSIDLAYHNWLLPIHILPNVPSLNKFIFNGPHYFEPRRASRDDRPQVPVSGARNTLQKRPRVLEDEPPPRYEDIELGMPPPRNPSPELERPARAKLSTDDGMGGPATSL
ncbi:MAG: hypothetical protein M1820_003901 [Bogoriella megaspora]|nr:MAG: hypothetical protein M1820_003901 [Bogoriella megaspora]